MSPIFSVARNTSVKRLLFGFVVKCSSRWALSRRMSETLSVVRVYDLCSGIGLGTEDNLGYVYILISSQVIGSG